MRTEVTVGQYLDLLAQDEPWDDDPDRVEARAREVIRSKSARYSVEHPLRLGAALAGADDEALAACRAIGLPLGEAFQLRDDLLGVFGDPATTGKPAGDDLVEGKRSVLVALALDAAGAAEAARLDEALGTPLSEPEIEELRAIIDGCGARAQVETMIDDLAQQAVAALHAGQADEGWDAGACRVLEQLATAATRRTR